MSEAGKPVIIPTSSGALATEEWRLPDGPAREKRTKDYRAQREAFIDGLLAENARLRKLLADAGVKLHPYHQTEGE